MCHMITLTSWPAPLHTIGIQLNIFYADNESVALYISNTLTLELATVTVMVWRYITPKRDCVVVTEN